MTTPLDDLRAEAARLRASAQGWRASGAQADSQQARLWDEERAADEDRQALALEQQARRLEAAMVAEMTTDWPDALEVCRG